MGRSCFAPVFAMIDRNRLASSSRRRPSSHHWGCRSKGLAPRLPHFVPGCCNGCQTGLAKPPFLTAASGVLMPIIFSKSISGYRCHCDIADLGLEAPAPLVPRRGALGEKDSEPWAKADLDGSYSHPLQRLAWPHTVQDTCISPAMSRSTATPSVSMAGSRRQPHGLDCIPSRLGMRHPLLGRT